MKDLTSYPRTCNPSLHYYSKATKGINLQKLPAKLGNKIVLIDFYHIMYISAAGCYAEITTYGDKYVIRESLNNIIKILDPADFFRVHRSSIVNLHFVQEITYSNHAEIDLQMKDKKIIRVSKSNKKTLLGRWGI